MGPKLSPEPIQPATTAPAPNAAELARKREEKRMKRFDRSKLVIEPIVSPEASGGAVNTPV